MTDNEKIAKAYEYSLAGRDVINLDVMALSAIDIFEQLLAKHNIYIPDGGRRGDPDEAYIYGITYLNLENELVAMLKKSIDIIRKYPDKPLVDDVYI